MAYWLDSIDFCGSLPIPVGNLNLFLCLIMLMEERINRQYVIELLVRLVLNIFFVAD